MITHNYTQQAIKIIRDEGTATLEYYVQDNKIYFIHTYTPPDLSGQGIAARLVEAGLTYAQENNLTPVPICSYVVNYIERNTKSNTPS